MTETIPLSVVVPTIGRVERLRACLASLSRCQPGADEILVVDQSGEGAVQELASSFPRVRIVPSTGEGVSQATNAGLRDATREIVLVTHDDCTVAPSWVAVAWRLMEHDPRKLITGRVLPTGDPRAVSSIKDDPFPDDYTGRLECGALFPNNMVVDRLLALELGGFDERFGPSEPAEDNDFCYRWLRAGHRLRYEPDLVVWHHEWRSISDLSRLYISYGRGQGFFYAKHLRQGDTRVLRFLLRDLRNATHSAVARAIHGPPKWPNPSLGLARGLPAGLVNGWRELA